MMDAPAPHLASQFAAPPASQAAADAAPQVVRFPMRLVAGVAAATLALLVWLAGMLYVSYLADEDEGHRILKLSGARGQIVHLDEVLTMSANMAAATGQTFWIDRYRSFEPALDAAIKTAAEIARSPAVAKALKVTDAANDDLVDMENKAFALISDGKAEAARAILSGEAYLRQKQVYAQGMRDLGEELDHELDAMVENRLSAARDAIIATVIVSALILLTWMLLFRRVALWSRAVMANYTARVEAEAALRKVNDELETQVADRTRALTQELSARQLAEKKVLEIQRMRTAGQLTGGVAHEFNNLLAVIKSNTEDLRDEIQDALLKRQVELTLSAADRGAALVRQLLAFSRKQEMQPRLLDLNAFLDDFVTLARPSLEAHIALEVHKGAEVPPINVDPGHLENALLNILFNSRDAMSGPGAITIETAVTVLDPDYVAEMPDLKAGVHVLVAITDTGTGMTQAVLDSAFVPFFTTKEVGQGTGLGLSTVHGFVTQSGGHVRLYSEPGHGTTVKLYFPPAAPIGPALAAPAADTAPAPATGHILVVEDNDLVRASVEGKLKRFGYGVTAVGSAAEAITTLDRDRTIALVFSDVIMPGAMNGADLAREVQKRWPRLKLLLTSGYTEMSTLGKVQIPQGVRLLSKPYANAELAKALREVLA